MSHPALRLSPGKPYPLGAHCEAEGVRFALVSGHASAVWLQIYADSEDEWPLHEFQLDPVRNRTGDVWHVIVHGISAGALYMYRIDGPFLPHEGFRYNNNRPLLDPYTRALTGGFRWDLTNARAYESDSDQRDLSFRREGGAKGLPKCIVIDDQFDWGDDRPLNVPLSEAIIYEAHVKGLSRHPSSGVEHPGTYRGVIEMIPYLTELGITSLELLPIHDFDEFEGEWVNPATGASLGNYWGYNTLAFFAPKASYAADGQRGEQVREFKEMVRALHAAGIEVLLDVVFNHSGEGNEMGPTISFRGIDNTNYYMLDEDRRYYRNFSGTGNTLNCNNPVMRTFITECLHYWVVEMHVDGFRFDLGSILSRGQDGSLIPNAPIIERIAQDPILRDTKIIAEAWDAGGAYQVGGFPGRWSEWNDKFRDEVRRYWRGDRHTVAGLATRLAGSSDLYHSGGRKPFHSINFVTSHDGFTLYDLVSYNRKHNEANGEGNRDGHDGNYSYNHGVEGETDDPAIKQLRIRQMKNMLATLMLSLGTPMLVAGDEFARTQGGNNNAYCQDNSISWLDYSLVERHRDLHRFARMLIDLRKRHPVFRRREFYTGEDLNRNRRADIAWFDSSGQPMEWARAGCCLAVYIDGGELAADGGRADDDFYIMFNTGHSPSPFSVPEPPQDTEWGIVIDTYATSPGDIVPPEQQHLLSDPRYRDAGDGRQKVSGGRAHAGRVEVNRAPWSSTSMECGVSVGPESLVVIRSRRVGR